MAKKSKSVLALEAAGFEVLVVHEGRWFEVVKDGEAGVVARQHEGAWHWFSQQYEATASGSNPADCDMGGLGDALDTDVECRTYERLVINAPQALLVKYAGLYRASGDCYNSRS